MKINRSNVIGGEVDFTSQYKDRDRHGRISLRYKDNRYEVYIHWFNDKTDEVIHHSTNLADCIEFTNARFGLNDTVTESAENHTNAEIHKSGKHSLLHNDTVE